MKGFPPRPIGGITGHAEPYPRRRSPHSHDAWHVYFADVRVGTICKRSGAPVHLDQWGWSCGFYPGLEPGEHQSGSAPTFEAARAGFEAAWQRLLPKLSTEDFARYRRNRAFPEWKTMKWDCGCRMPTQEPTGRSRRYCGTPIDLKTTEAHVYTAHMTPA